MAGILWSDKTNLIDLIIQDIDAFHISPLPAGLEAEVWNIRSDTVNAVLKIWNKESSPDVGYQYAMLRALRERGVSVSEPYGWGFDAANNKTLVTSFDGSPVAQTGRQTLTELAHLLWALHSIPINDVDSSLHRTYDFMAYFFPALQQNPDIQATLIRLVDKSGLRQDTIIHGDYNLGNILVHHGKYTLIDWTNAQLGDPRYDAAWAGFLIGIYNGEEPSAIFLDAYLAESGCLKGEIEIFEAIACLRWVLLNRIVDLPKHDETIARVNNIIRENQHLNQELIF